MQYCWQLRSLPPTEQRSRLHATSPIDRRIGSIAAGVSEFPISFFLSPRAGASLALTFSDSEKEESKNREPRARHRAADDPSDAQHEDESGPMSGKTDRSLQQLSFSSRRSRDATRERAKTRRCSIGAPTRAAASTPLPQRSPRAGATVAPRNGAEVQSHSAVAATATPARIDTAQLLARAVRCHLGADGARKRSRPAEGLPVGEALQRGERRSDRAPALAPTARVPPPMIVERAERAVGAPR
jgi:hypothetical protein